MVAVCVPQLLCRRLCAVREAPPWARRAAAGAAEGAHACDKPTGARARAEAAGMPLGGPFIFMNTDLSVFSADLARAIVRGRCLRRFITALYRITSLYSSLSSAAQYLYEIHLLCTCTVGVLW